MDSESPQFDSTLGGNVELPDVINIKSFYSARFDEIKALSALIDCPSSNILFKKKFPKHLRRRAMSQNVKRLPSRLRDESISKREKSGVRETPLKRPRRKYRRRPANLLADYNRRQRDHIWLETHIWHAKRFHMIDKWGYKLPLHPNDKSYRACYRASAKHCLIQDISYYCCIEISGKPDELINGLNRHCSTECGLTFNSSYIRTGCYEGSVFFYEFNKYPKGAIGEVSYFWNPLEEDSRRVIWLWCHPSIHNQIIDELTNTFSLDKEESMVIGEDDLEDIQETNVEKIKLLCRNVPFMKTPKYNSSKNSIRMILLKDTLNRFRLTGPLSQAIITQAFQPVDLGQRTVEDWGTKYHNTSPLSNKVQIEFWNKMKNFATPAQLPRHLIFSMVVTDPRFTLPHCRKKAECAIEDINVQTSLNVPPELPLSPLWSSNIRDEVTSNKLSTHKLNEMRSNKLVPGLEIESKWTNNFNLPVIPMILIQYPGENNESKPLGYGSGWDIIVPCGYGMPVWLGLNYHGGRAGGLKEHNNVSREQGRIMFPPDTEAGREQSMNLKGEDTEKYFALPPAQRENFIKLGIPTPFHCPWEILMEDWIGSKNYHVLRNRQKLLQLNNKLKNPSLQVSFDNVDNEALVPIILKLSHKGTLSRNSHICIPEKKDYLDIRTGSTLIEPQHDDIFKTKRKTCRVEHKTLLKKLARKRKKEKKNKELDSSQSLEPSNSSNAVVAKQKEIMRDLWLPNCGTIKNHCSRTIFGFVCDADFSFTNGRTVALGFVTLIGLLELFSVLSEVDKKHTNFVLVRSINTNQYRFAEMKVIIQ